ncbi:MAG TPA: hypothetical protein PK313_08420, partial [Myxococcota bacterium]|nr:hypothetical protein [Myxococcota bacterium]
MGGDFAGHAGGPAGRVQRPRVGEDGAQFVADFRAGQVGQRDPTACRVLSIAAFAEAGPDLEAVADVAGDDERRTAFGQVDRVRAGLDEGAL